MARHGGGSRPICECVRSIDIRDLKRRDLLHIGLEFPHHWSRAGEPHGYITIHIETDAAILRSWHGSCESSDLEQRVPIEWSACYLGGQRPWFRCDAYIGDRHCGRRVAILYGLGRMFACRRCYGLAYASQQESPRFRNISRSRKIRMRLGGSANLGERFPAKPHGMHRSTYHRLRARGEAADRLAFGQLRFPLRPLRRYQAALSELR
jgi:hypothetical protein